MRQIFAFVMAAIAVCPIVLMALAASRTEDEATPIFGIKMPPGYRDWNASYLAPTGSPEAVAHLRFPQNVACGFPALRSSEDGSQHCKSL